jgi:hypothetical protein
VASGCARITGLWRSRRPERGQPGA